jgi:hypothetical protein
MRYNPCGNRPASKRAEGGEAAEKSTGERREEEPQRIIHRESKSGEIHGGNLRG